MESSESNLPDNSSNLNSNTGKSDNTNSNGGVSGRPKQSYSIKFHGSNMQFLGLSLYNLLLTVLTLGLYYPWAKCAIRKFLWQETEIDGSRVEWHGTGKEMFKGFIKAYLFVGGLLIIINYGPYFLPAEILGWVIIIAYLGLLAFVPLAIHGMARYRLSRTSFRGIHFGYRGNLGEFYKKAALDLLYSILSLGIYSYWFVVNIRKYVLQHTRYGKDVRGDFIGSGGELFGLTLVNGLLMYLTLFIYTPWALIKFFKFDIENIRIYQGENNKLRLVTNAKGGQYFIVLIKAALITIFTLGICGPIGRLMIHKYLTESLILEGWFDFDAVEQSEESYKDATGDDMMDILDFDM
jgi:uncharacterized membrane protein YjgN (DUF898 family)